MAKKKKGVGAEILSKDSRSSQRQFWLTKLTAEQQEQCWIVKNGFHNGETNRKASELGDDLVEAFGINITGETVAEWIRKK
tara:strand:+ start:252 stop:494 length:243 start_codon:yes stop_codon:yes gene_type:complete